MTCRMACTIRALSHTPEKPADQHGVRRRLGARRLVRHKMVRLAKTRRDLHDSHDAPSDELAPGRFRECCPSRHFAPSRAWRF